jgi:protein TonB
MFMKGTALVIAASLVMAGCNKGSDPDKQFSGVGARPDILPVMLNKDLPIRYPASLYAKKVQANVTLRVFIDKEGQVVAESTHVAESSGFPPLDSAAVRGSGELRFIPAKTRGEAVPVSILFPVYFRHPDAPPLPGDTILKKSGAATVINPPTAAAPKDTVKSAAVSKGSAKPSTKSSVKSSTTSSSKKKR